MAVAPHSSTLAWKIPWTERLHFHFSLSCIGEGNGHPCQYSRPSESQGLGAWWAAVYGVAESQTGLKWLSSSSSIFSCAYWPSVCLFWRNVCFDLLPIFLLGCFFFYIELYELYVYFGDNSLVSCIICKYFLPFYSLFFCFVGQLLSLFPCTGWRIG